MNKNLDWVHHDSKTFDEEEFMEEIERKYIQNHTVTIKGYTENYVKSLQKEISRLNNIIDELEKYIQDSDNWYVKIDYKNYNPYINVANVLDKLNELKQK